MDMQQLIKVVQMALGGMNRGNNNNQNYNHNYNNNNNNNNRYDNNNNHNNNRYSNEDNIRRGRPSPEPREPVVPIETRLQEETRYAGPGANLCNGRLCTEAPFGVGEPSIEEIRLPRLK